VPDRAGHGDRFDIEFEPPAGLERVVVFASRTPWAEYANLMRMNEGRQRTAALARSVVLSRGSRARKFQSKLQVLLQPLSFQVDNLRLAGQRHQTPGGALAAGG